MRTTEQRTAAIAAVGDGNADVDGLIDVLSEPRRRFLLAVLDEQSEPMAVADAATELAQWECDSPRDQLPDEEVRSRYIHLHHVDVPKMADAGVIEHDRERNTIALADEYDSIATRTGLSVE